MCHGTWVLRRIRTCYWYSISYLHQLALVRIKAYQYYCRTRTRGDTHEFACECSYYPTIVLYPYSAVLPKSGGTAWRLGRAGPGSGFTAR
eukprot:scaffold204364_cov51-Prasinocladus_malaysianus.AAC.1